MHSDADLGVEVFYARHPEKARAQGENYDSTAQLTEKGKQQAKFLIERFHALGVLHVVTSTATRAIGPALTHASELGMEAIGSDLFLEWRRPTATKGVHHSDPSVYPSLSRRLMEFGPDYVALDGEESWDEAQYIVERQLQFLLEYAKNAGVTRVGVIGHGLRMRMLCCRVMLGSFDPDVLPALFRVVHQTTGIEEAAMIRFWYGRHFRTAVRGWNMELGDNLYLPEALRC